MVRLARLFLPRFALVVAAAGAGWLFLVSDAGPSRAEAAVRLHLQDLSELTVQLEKSAERLRDLPDSGELRPREIHLARLYANLIAETIGTVGQAEVAIPAPVPNQGGDPTLRSFNALVSDPAYQSVLRDGAAAVNASRELVSYRLAALRALSRVIEYTPGRDLAAAEGETLRGRLAATQGGLARAEADLGSLPAYDDPDLAEIREVLRLLRQDAESLLAELESGGVTPVEKERFIAAFRADQERIVANRHRFWVRERDRHLRSLEEAQAKLGPYRQQLGRLG